jgi:hypothetical protein
LRKVTTKKGDSMLIVQIEDDSGGPYELVAFPKSYEKFKDVLKEEALLRIHAKVERDRRGDGFTLLLEGVALIDVSAPAPELPAPAVPSLREVVSEYPISTDPGMATADEAPLPEAPPPRAESAPSPKPPPVEVPSAPSAEPVSIIRPRAKAATSNGNGHSNGNGKHHAQGNGNEQMSNNGNGNQRRLLLLMPVTEDYDQAVRLMQQVRGLLEQSAAHDHGDQVIIRLPSTMGTVVLKQRDMVTCNGPLLAGLREVLGTEAVLVEG